MVVELTAQSQITIPKEIANKIGATIGSKLNIAIHGKNIILAPISEKPWTASDIWESEELIPSSLVKAAGLQDWDKDGFAYPSAYDFTDVDSNDEYMKKLKSLAGSITDPTFFDSINARPIFGSGKGKMWIAEDFDAPLDELKEYME